jgi:hypothetical protein
MALFCIKLVVSSLAAKHAGTKMNERIFGTIGMSQIFGTKA